MPGVGASFAGCQIQGLLGQGGMGTVYLAQHPRLPRNVALKLLNREVSTDPELARRFEREADVIARLEHPELDVVLGRAMAKNARTASPRAPSSSLRLVMCSMTAAPSRQ